MVKVLLYSDDDLQTDLLSVLLPSFSILESTGLENGEGIRSGTLHYDAIILDLALPGWRKLLRSLRGRAIPPPPVICMAPETAVQEIVLALREGAWEWLAKPVRPEQLHWILARALQHRVPEMEACEDPAFTELLGVSRSLTEVKRLIRKFAAAGEPILLTGESGTGKGVVAKALHDISPRREGPFCFRNCGALTPTLIESELFGTLSGAYTGAVDRPGCIEESNGGTFFLDEIGELSLASQVKLLRVLEEGVFYRLGSTTPLMADARFIAATNRNLMEMVAGGTFREDLYYRLNILSIAIPPLRERKEDIPLLSAYFLKKFPKELDERALDRIIEHDWPGNVRQLSACLTRAALVADGTSIGVEDLLL